jgi:hypothetical protein
MRSISNHILKQSTGRLKNRAPERLANGQPWENAALWEKRATGVMGLPAQAVPSIEGIKNNAAQRNQSLLPPVRAGNSAQRKTDEVE